MLDWTDWTPEAIAAVQTPVPDLVIAVDVIYDEVLQAACARESQLEPCVNWHLQPQLAEPDVQERLASNKFVICPLLDENCGLGRQRLD